MFPHPYITAKVAEERRRDLIAHADAYRLARAAREGRPAERRQHRLAIVRVPAQLTYFVAPLTRRSARSLRLRWRRAAVDGG
jgi:hypothetical protein